MGKWRAVYPLRLLREIQPRRIRALDPPAAINLPALRRIYRHELKTTNAPASNGGKTPKLLKGVS